MGDATNVLLLSAVDFAEARAIFGSGDEKRCAAVLKILPAAAEDAMALGRGVTALLLGAEGLAVSER